MSRSACVLLLVLVSGASLLVPACASKEERIAEARAAAKQAAAQGDSATAILELKQALRLAPESPEINLDLARTFEADHNAENATFYYREVERLDPTDTQAALAEARLLVGADNDRAEQLARGVLAREPANAMAHVRLSELAVVKKDLPTALLEAKTATELAPTQGSSWLMLGIVHLARIRALLLKKEPVPSEIYEAADHAFARGVDLAQTLSDVDQRTPAVRAAIERANLYAAWKGHWKSAVASYHKAFEFASGQPLAQRLSVLQAASHSGRTRPGRGLEKWALEQWVELSPDSLARWERLAALSADPKAPRSEVLLAMVQANPRSAAAHIAYARDLDRRGDAQGAITHLRQAEKGLDSPEAALAAVVSLQIGHGALAEARDTLALLQKRDSAGPEALLASAELAEAEERYLEAADLYQKLVRVQPKPQYSFKLAVAEMRVRRYPKALDAINQVLKGADRTKPLFMAALRQRARLELAVGNPGAAVQTFRRIRKGMKGLQVADLTVFARALYQTGSAAQGRRVLEVALAREDPPVAAAVEFVRREGKRAPDDARRVLDKALSRHPGERSLVLAAAQLDVLQGNPDAGIQRLVAASEAAPKDARLREQVARMLAAQGRLAEALAESQRAVALGGGPMATLQVVRLLTRLGRRDEAIQDLASRKDLSPGEHVLLSRLYDASGDTQRAIQELETALAANPQQAGAQNNLAYLLAREGGDLGRALDLAQQAQQSMPKSASVADTLGFVLLESDRLEAALSQFNAAVEFAEPQSAAWATAQYHRGLALQALKRPEKAAGAFELALASSVDFPESAAARKALKGLSGS